MADSPELTPAQKLRVALDLCEAGIRMMRQTLRREHPEASDAEIARLLDDWLATRPGAEIGDISATVARPRPLPGPAA